MEKWNIFLILILFFVSNGTVLFLNVLKTPTNFNPTKINILFSNYQNGKITFNLTGSLVNHRGGETFVILVPLNPFHEFDDFNFSAKIDYIGVGYKASVAPLSGTEFALSQYY